MKSLKLTYILIVIALIGGLFQISSTEEKLNEKDKIIANLKGDATRNEEITKIRENRQIQIDALIQIITNYKEDVINKRPNITIYPLIASIELLGTFRAIEAVNPLIDLVVFEFKDPESGITDLSSTDAHLAWIERCDVCQKALTQIGKPVVPSLVNLLKQKPSNSLQSGLKGRFVRKTIYLIEDDCAIHHLEKALKEETDKKKKENLSEAISKFKEELKAGAYNK